MNTQILLTSSLWWRRTRIRCQILDWVPSPLAVDKGPYAKTLLKNSLLSRSLSNYKENWYATTFPYEEGALKWYAKNFLRDAQGWICWRCCQVLFHN